MSAIQLSELLPSVAQSLEPPGDGAGDVLGVDEDALRPFALDGPSRHLEIIGVPLESF